jgi:hypothetical protein
MISSKEVNDQLKKLKVNFQFYGNAGLRELKHILVENEQMQHCLNGRYDGGFAVLCITDMRVLLIDKKPFSLTLEDIRYDMVVEVDYSYRLLNATVRICTPNKTLRFTTLKRQELREATSQIQTTSLVIESTRKEQNITKY